MRKIHKFIVAGAIAVVGVGGIAVAANGAVKPDCKSLMYPLCPRSVAAGQVVDNSLPGYKKLAPGSVSEDRLSKPVQDMLHAVGTSKPGKDGKDGTNGTDGVSGYEVIAKEVALPAGSADAAPVAVTASCPEGKVAIGGGYKIDKPGSVDVFHSMGAGLTKTEAGTWISTGWDVKVQNAGGKTNMTAFATCAAIAK